MNLSDFIYSEDLTRKAERLAKRKKAEDIIKLMNNPIFKAIARQKELRRKCLLKRGCYEYLHK